MYMVVVLSEKQDVLFELFGFILKHVIVYFLIEWS